MTEFRAIQIAKGIEQAQTEAEYLEAWQTLIDGGYAFKQAWSSSAAIGYIETGQCSLPKGAGQ